MLLDLQGIGPMIQPIPYGVGPAGLNDQPGIEPFDFLKYLLNLQIKSIPSGLAHADQTESLLESRAVRNPTFTAESSIPMPEEEWSILDSPLLSLVQSPIQHSGLMTVPFLENTGQIARSSPHPPLESMGDVGIVSTSQKASVPEPTAECSSFDLIPVLAQENLKGELTEKTIPKNGNLDIERQKGNGRYLSEIEVVHNTSEPAPTEGRDSHLKSQKETLHGEPPIIQEDLGPMVQATLDRTQPGNTHEISSEAKIESKSDIVFPEVIKGAQSLAHQGGGKMVVSLHPPQLGELQISVTARGKKVEIEISPDNAVTKSLLESSLNQLKQSIQTQDLIVSRIEVNSLRDSAELFENTFASLANGKHFEQFDGFGRQQQNRGQHFDYQGPLLTAVNTSVESRFNGSGRLDLRI